MKQSVIKLGNLNFLKLHEIVNVQGFIDICGCEVETINVSSARGTVLRKEVYINYKTNS